MVKTAFFTGVSGQDGAYLSRFVSEQVTVDAALRHGTDAMSQLRNLGIGAGVRVMTDDLVDPSFR